MLEPGAVVPDFALVDQGGVLVDSNSLLSSWYLLYWYPKADTPGCTAQAEGLAAQFEVFSDLGCQIFGASCDDVDDIQAFHTKYQLPFRLLSDLDRRVALALEAVGSSIGTARRVAYLVAPGGRVARAYEVEDPAFFAERVLDDLELLLIRE
jgi:peroxiredoxin Q/BCP